MNILTIENFTKSFTDRLLFDNTSFSMQEGEKVGVIGINGMGKSTLLKIVAGIEEPEIGEMITNKNLKVAYLSQNPKEETIITDKAKVLLNKLKRFTFDAPIEKLSGGQRKCIALANILTQDSDLLILFFALGVSTKESQSGEGEWSGEAEVRISTQSPVLSLAERAEGTPLILAPTAASPILVCTA